MILLLLAALVPYLVLVSIHWSVGPSVDSGDYAQYLLHAKALAEGRPYGDIGYIYTRHAYAVGPPLQPPGFPLTLAPVVALFGTHSPLVKLVVVLSGVAFLLCSGFYCSRLAGPLPAAIAVAFTGVALEANYATNSPMADLGFCALVWASLIVADAPGRITVGRVAAVAGLGLAAMSYRAAGLALLPTMVIWALIDRERRRLALSVLAVWLGAAIVVLLVAPEAVPFGDQLQRLRGVPERVVRLVRLVPRPLAEAHLYPLPNNLANDLYHVVSVAMLVIGGAVAFFRQRGAAIWAFAAAYVGMLAVSPVVTGRYLWPLFPLAALCLAMGTLWVGERVLRQPLAVRVGTAALVLIVASAGLRTALAPPQAILAEYPGIQPLFAWIRDLGQREPVRVMFVNPRVLTLETGVPAMAVIWTQPADVVLQEVDARRITHVVMGDPAEGEAYLQGVERLLESAPERFTLEYRNPSFAVYRVGGRTATP